MQCHASCLSLHSKHEKEAERLNVLLLQYIVETAHARSGNFEAIESSPYIAPDIYQARVYTAHAWGTGRKGKLNHQAMQ